MPIIIRQRVYRSSAAAILATGKSYLYYDVPDNGTISAWGSELISTTIVGIEYPINP